MTTPNTAGVRERLDDAPVSRFHLKAAVTAGMGFFTDSYDLNVIGTVILLVKPEFHLSAGQVGALTSSTLLAVAVGAFLFGRLGDLLGRRRVYGLEAVLMIVGALASAFAPNFISLLIARVVLGIGIGGDYPASGVIMTEYANRRNRGRLVGLTFLFYVFGQVAAYVVALIIVGLGTPPGPAWRLILGLGAIPSLLVLWNRRHMPESPRWTLASTGDAEQAARDLSVFSGRVVEAADTDRAPESVTLWKALRSRSFQLTLLGTAGSWLFFNVAVYGNSVSQPLLINSIAPHTSIVMNIAINAALVVCFSLVAALVGLALLDRIGRKPLQISGFSLSALSMVLIAAIPGLTSTVTPFAVVFGLSLFGIAVGPNYTTMLLAAESYPTSIRSTAHGISAGTAKVGAFLGALITPVALAHLGLRPTVLIAGACFVLGIVATMLLAEPKGTKLDALDPLDTDAAGRKRRAGNLIAPTGSQPVSA
ncbi:MFS transporter [Mycobacterium sp. Aquia_216]|uniref:MFS transporter n=1 Tax=Mycobacterium sp. Aquia_216 TaxID=2991729 RepID=UPI00227D4BED|nr:MFS transporter [Mycobacterium sp. Aquia_216]WAJ45426.1 MFS transporter [Mycobacterium sp. Aquia_216]